MPAITKKVEDLQLNEMIQTSSDYSSGFGIDIDDESRSISVDIGDLKTTFIQRVDDGCYASYESGIAKGTQTSALTPNAIAQGYKSVAGGYALKIISGDLNTNTMKFKSNLSDYKELLDEYAQLSGKVSYKLEGNYTQAMSIISIDYDANAVEFTQIPTPINSQDGYVSSNNTFYKSSPLTLQYTMWFPQKGSKFSVIGDIPLGQNSIALGYECLTFADECHAEGAQTVAEGRYAHAEGYNTDAGYGAHAQGVATKAIGNFSHAEGWNNEANETLTHAAGFLSRAIHSHSFVWNGNVGDDPYNYPYRGNYLSSHGVGTFNIGPKNDISGFFIGNKSLYQILKEWGGGDKEDIAYLSGQIDDLKALIGDMNNIVDDILYN